MSPDKLPVTVPHQWTHTHDSDTFLISTDPSLIPLSTLNDALGSDRLHWATRLSEAELKVMVESSVCFGVYHVVDLDGAHVNNELNTADGQSGGGDLSAAAAANSTTPQQLPLVGFARLVTDRVTFAYLTDVYIAAEYERRGLGGKLIDCVKEWTGLIPKLRELTLITGGGKHVYYEKKLGTKRIEVWNPDIGMYVAKGPAWPSG